MKCEFSETQYMFGVMREVAALLKPSGGWMAPLFPTQNDEKNLGYDCAFPGKVRTLYLQFKVPEKKTRSNAAHWSDFSTSYYQFKIWDASRTDQHNLLVSLAQKDPRYRVYYCSPAFISQTDYTNFYLTERIARNSIFVPCKTLPPISGNDQHHICYTRDPERYQMYSNPQVIRGMEWETFLSEVRKSEPYPSLETCLTDISQKFEIQLSDFDSPEKMYREIAAPLLVRHNLHLILF